MKKFNVGDLVRDVLNAGEGSYGLGVVVRTGKCGILENSPTPEHRPWPQEADVDEGPRFDVYFNKFERVITFHGDYLEKV
tara:strand:+ start:1605 stop:1844 length:240 start_codon:yes stop_codon:yes gene_type:complete